ncbi:MAG: FtsQ-type POTRA domain-containing protein [Myxococcales bacterium]|nr:FtsQ-type POTRA domain-containing protein [Myxococcales bacterium]
MSLLPRRKPARRSLRNRRGVWLRALLFWRPRNRRLGRAAPKPSPTDERRPPRSAVSVLLTVVTWTGLLALLGATVILGRHYLLHSPRFAVETVEISPTKHVSTERLRSLAGVELGRNLISLDKSAVAQRLRQEPWLRHIHVETRLPAQLRIVVEEFEPAALVALDAIYMITAEGEVFRRATAADYDDKLPILTGVGRAAYLLDREWAQAELRRGLHALSLYQQRATRPQVREVHIDQITGITLSTAHGATIRLGQGSDEELTKRLARFDAVWLQLRQKGESAQLLLLDNRAHPDHVTVRLASKPSRP